MYWLMRLFKECVFITSDEAKFSQVFNALKNAGLKPSFEMNDYGNRGMSHRTHTFTAPTPIHNQYAIYVSKKTADQAKGLVSLTINNN